MSGNLFQSGCDCCCVDSAINHVQDFWATGGLDGVYTYHTSGSIQWLLCQDDADGSSLDWGVTATFSFDPDTGHPSVSQSPLSASWAEHHTGEVHSNCDCGDLIPDATGTWTVTISHTGYDCCDAAHLSTMPCAVTDCPTYTGGDSLAEMKGLGDAVAKITSAIGIKPCAGCKKRQETLNKAVPFRR